MKKGRGPLWAAPLKWRTTGVVSGVALEDDLGADCEAVHAIAIRNRCGASGLRVYDAVPVDQEADVRVRVPVQPDGDDLLTSSRNVAVRNDRVGITSRQLQCATARAAEAEVLIGLQTLEFAGFDRVRLRTRFSGEAVGRSNMATLEVEVPIAKK